MYGRHQDGMTGVSGKGCLVKQNKVGKTFTAWLLVDWVISLALKSETPRGTIRSVSGICIDRWRRMV